MNSMYTATSDLDYYGQDPADQPQTDDRSECSACGAKYVNSTCSSNYGMARSLVCSDPCAEELRRRAERRIGAEMKQVRRERGGY